MRVTDLPPEVVASVFRNLESLEELGHCILTCHHFNNTFTEYKDIPGTILASSWDSELLPLAVATELVSGLPKPRTGHAVRDFVDSLVYDPRHLSRTLKRMDVSSLLSMVKTQDAILDLAFDMAEDAFQNFDFQDYAIAYEEGDVGLSPAEATRFCRAFYRTQLYFGAFDKDSASTTLEGQKWLLASFAMFEVEQIACVYDYLERLVLKLTRYTLAKERSFGKERYDFIRLGQNEKIERFINQGVVWIASLFNLDPEEKVQVLRDELRTVGLHEADFPRLHRAIVSLRRAAYDENGTAKGIKEPRDNFDSDSGPPSAYDYANMDLMETDFDPAAGTFLQIVPGMQSDDYGLRERAYVLWDMSRMKDQDLFYQIEAAPQDSSMQPDEWQWSLMDDWHYICQVPWDDIKNYYPRIFECHNDWEQTLMKDNVEKGNRLCLREAWRTEQNEEYGTGDGAYFVE